MSILNISETGNIHLNLDNGITVSVFIGAGSLSETVKKSGVYISKNCEIAFLDKNFDFITRDIMTLIDNKYSKLNDNVVGFLDIDDVLDLIQKVKKFRFY